MWRRERERENARTPTHHQVPRDAAKGSAVRAGWRRLARERSCPAPNCRCCGAHRGQLGVHTPPRRVHPPVRCVARACASGTPPRGRPRPASAPLQAMDALVLGLVLKLRAIDVEGIFQDLVDPIAHPDYAAIVPDEMTFQIMEQVGPRHDPTRHGARRPAPPPPPPRGAPPRPSRRAPWRRRKHALRSTCSRRWRSLRAPTPPPPIRPAPRRVRAASASAPANLPAPPRANVGWGKAAEAAGRTGAAAQSATPTTARARPPSVGVLSWLHAVRFTLDLSHVACRMPYCRATSC